ncbi:GNAT family N-acetyltransferase [Henriciella aquimarina]|uniref:GNAT family N-acetyltransferase n=1 Tax=Henriciella aquimarina TaxID=545261 RepID=UPI001F23D8D6|nr:GNAT family N-acetyltransferase [Henriciella aquimarina]
MSMARPVPVILTERLKLRAHEASDFEALAAHWRHPDVVRFIGGGSGRTPHEVWTRNILRNRGLWEVLGYGYWLVEERKTGAFVGEVGFADFHRDTEPTFWGAPECGWIISPDRHGQGCASEAVRAIHDWLDTETDESKSVCIIDPENHASIRISEKLGYKQSGSVRMSGEDVLYFERTRHS